MEDRNNEDQNEVLNKIEGEKKSQQTSFIKKHIPPAIPIECGKITKCSRNGEIY